MSHAVESMFYVGEEPWHGLGTKLNEAPTVSQAIVEAGLNWEVGLKDLQTVDALPVPAKATYRMSDGRILGVVGPRYTPLQNQSAFDWFQPFLDTKEAMLHTAGSLHEGQKVWVLAALNREPSVIVPGDEVCKFILLSNSHDGTTAIRVGFTPIRVVCANTLSMAHGSEGSKLIRIKHTKSNEVNLEKVRDVMNTVNACFEATAEQYRFLASKQFNTKDVREYVKVILNAGGVEDAKLPTRTRNNIDAVMNRVNGPRQNMAGVRGTWWAAYNGVTEWMNYEQGRNNNNRIQKLWFNNAEVNRALTFATEFAEKGAEAAPVN